MKHINPLHVGVLFVVVLIFLFVQLVQTRDALHEAQQEYEMTKKMATELVGLKKVYADGVKIQSSLQRVLRQPSLSSANLQKQSKKDGMVISSSKIDANALNSLMGKLLNGTYNIVALEIKKIDAKYAKLKVEIKW